MLNVATLLYYVRGEIIEKQLRKSFFFFVIVENNVTDLDKIADQQEPKVLICIRNYTGMQICKAHG